MNRLQLALLGLAMFLTAGLASAAGYRVVVNDSNPTTSMTRSEISKLFLKKKTKWANGQRVVPVDLTSNTQSRERFSLDVHGKGTDAIKAYWQSQIFSGRGTPPSEVSSNNEVLSFVRTNSGAIGYVSEGTQVDDGVKFITVTDD